MCNSKVERQFLEEICENCFLNIRTDIWLERCSKISEIEKGKGITMVDKKRKREDQSDVTTEISLEDGSEEKTNTLKKVQKHQYNAKRIERIKKRHYCRK
ncbi:hypothetical protein RhiirA4_476927 [Rhizophagus irregularis]|uniref:Uncharacterized protein n=1 Tax=Rhizophagus irregularis TaxID=588596 RepID=A0A2I1HCH3_9GLOM|nr:hypothetical protein RhiirA4_476927 [Rhizophagus irregularis]